MDNIFRNPPNNYLNFLINDEADTLFTKDAFQEIVKDMKSEGLSERTIQDYTYHFNRYLEVSGETFVFEVSEAGLRKYLSLGDVSNNTRNIRLKNMKAILNRFFKKGIIKKNFWFDIKINTEKSVKEASSKEDIVKVLSNLDMDNFSEFRDFVAIYLIYMTGLRSGTVSNLKYEMFDFDNHLLNVPPNIMKNKRAQIIPFPANLDNAINRLHDWNQLILKELDVENDYLFITTYGNPLENERGASALCKRIIKYNERFGTDIKLHGIRRRFATDMLNAGIDINTISNALNHSSLAVTTQYLDIQDKERIDKVNEFLKNR